MLLVQPASKAYETTPALTVKDCLVFKNINYKPHSQPNSAIFNYPKKYIFQ